MTMIKVEIEDQYDHKEYQKELTEQDLEHIIVVYKHHHGCETIGDVMKMLKMEYPNQFNGKDASKIAKRVLTQS